MPTPPDKLRTLLFRGRILTVPACFDAYSAHLAERAGFPATFMSGFSVAATRLALPDTGLISYGEMVDQGRRICEAVSIPVLGDGDTGYGNAMNIRRTVEGYARAGFAAVMIEDQVVPKRCGHTRGPVQIIRWPECASDPVADLEGPGTPFFDKSGTKKAPNGACPRFFSQLRSVDIFGNLSSLKRLCPI